MQLNAYRLQRGLSIAEFARRVGVSKQAMSRYDRGERIPRRDVMARIQVETGSRVKPGDFYRIDAKGPRASKRGKVDHVDSASKCPGCDQ